jgi:flagellin
VNLLVATAPTGGSNSLNIVQSVDGTAYSVANQLGGGTDLVNYLGLSSLNVNAGSGISTMGANIAFGTGTTVGTAGTASGTFVHTGTKTNNAFQLSYSTTDSKGVVTNRTMTFEFIDNANGSTNTQLQNAASSTNTEVAVNFDSSKDSTNQIVADLAQAIQSNGFGLVQQPDGSLNIVGGGLTGVDYGTASAGSFTSGGAKVTSASSTTTAQSESNGVSVLNLSTNKVNVTAVTSAVTKLNTISASLGAATQQITGMQNFTTALSSALTAGVGALTDADLAAESAQLSSLQTKQQLATQSLSIANQAPQSLLSLFKNL